jgi:hypothetical protein
VSYSSTDTKKIIKFVVDDSLTHEETRPSVAEFHVSQAYQEDVQKSRAKDYVNYLNRIAEATKNAYEENKLADKLKGVL